MHIFTGTHPIFVLFCVRYFLLLLLLLFFFWGGGLFVPYHTLPHHTIPHAPHHTIPHHTTTHHTTLYHTMQDTNPFVSAVVNPCSACVPALICCWNFSTTSDTMPNPLPTPETRAYIKPWFKLLYAGFGTCYLRHAKLNLV